VHKDLEDLERIYVWLTKVPDTIDCLVFVGNVYSNGVNFAQLKNAFFRLCNADTTQELARVNLAGPGVKGNTMVFSKLYRTSEDPGAPWQLLALGMPHDMPNASSVENLVPTLQKTGCAYPPKPIHENIPEIEGQQGENKPEKPAAGKEQKPSSILPAVGLAVAGTAGIAAAIALFTSKDDLPLDSFTSTNFLGDADFSRLEPVAEALEGTGDMLLEGAGAVYDWGGDVVSEVPWSEIGNGLGSAADFAASGCLSVGDGVVDAAPGVLEVAGDLAGQAGSGIVDGAGHVAGAAPGALEGARDLAGQAGSGIVDGAGHVVGAAPGALEGVENGVGLLAQSGADDIVKPGCCGPIIALIGDLLREVTSDKE
jgi:hypothetical protein